MFSVRANSSNDRKNKSKINYKNWEDIVKYPEHKNKSKDLLAEKDLNGNIQLIDKTKSFKKEVERFARDQRWKNKNIKQQITRDKKTKEEMEMWLEKKGVASNYTVQENAIFLQKKFNGDKAKVIDFYKKSLKSILEATGIDKERVIFATIHFDQSNPHLHFSISNLKTNYHGTLGREIMAVNGNNFNPIYQLKQDQNRRQKWIIENKLSNEERKMFKAKGYRTTFKTRFAEKLNFYGPVINKLNKEYESPIYQDKSDHISMRKVRGYERDGTSEKLDTLKWHNLKNKVICKFRETKLLKELASSEKNIKNEALLKAKQDKFQFQYSRLQEKYTRSINNKEFSMNPNISEQNVLKKKKYFLRKDIDLKILFGKNNIVNERNEILKNRFYNVLLYLCNEKQMTPQELTKSLYYGSYVPKHFKDQELNSMQSHLLSNRNFEPGKKIRLNQEGYNRIRTKIENNVEDSIDDLRFFINIDKNKGVSSELEKVKSNNIGIDAKFIKRARISKEIRTTGPIKSLPTRYRIKLMNNPQFIIKTEKELSKISYSNKGSFKKLTSTLASKNFIDGLDASMKNEIKAIQKLLEKNISDIEWEQEIER